jgi:peptidoglycan-associated lipoprotein
MAFNLRHVALCSLFVLAAACSKKKAPEPSLPDTNAAAAGAAAPAVVETPAAVSAPSALDTAEFASETIYFDFDSFTVRSSEMEKIRRLAAALKSGAGQAKVQVEGHCDERGSNEYNLALGERRARAIQDALTSEGVSASNVTTISYGEERPAVEGHDEFAYSKNRRAEFRKL